MGCLGAHQQHGGVLCRRKTVHSSRKDRRYLSGPVQKGTGETGSRRSNGSADDPRSSVYRGRASSCPKADRERGSGRLEGSVNTKNINRGKRIARQIDTGMVFINQATWTAPDLPFGGVKNSGYGRELAELGIGEFVNKKLIHVAA